MPEAALAGDLAVISLAGVLQLLEAEARTGDVAVADRGVIHLALGRPVHARFGRVEGIPAFLEMFIDAGGRFAFHERTRSGDVLGSVIGLIMEGCRLADEWRQLADLVVAPVPGAALGQHADLLADLDGARTLAEVFTGARALRVQVVDVVLELLAQGLLVQGASPPREAPASMEGYAEAVEEGRRQVRSGDLEAAEAAFTLALSLRPGDGIASQNLRRVRRARAGEPLGITSYLPRRRADPG